MDPQVKGYEPQGQNIAILAAILVLLVMLDLTYPKISGFIDRTFCFVFLVLICQPIKFLYEVPKDHQQDDTEV